MTCMPGLAWLHSHSVYSNCSDVRLSPLRAVTTHCNHTAVQTNYSNQKILQSFPLKSLVFSAMRYTHYYTKTNTSRGNVPCN